MPRAASRLTLSVTDVRIQRVQDINEEDAIAEGIKRDYAAGMTGVSGCTIICAAMTLRNGTSVIRATAIGRFGIAFTAPARGRQTLM